MTRRIDRCWIKGIGTVSLDMHIYMIAKQVFACVYPFAVYVFSCLPSKLLPSSSISDICVRLVRACLASPETDLQEQPFFGPNLSVRIIIYLLHIEHLASSLHERQVRSSSPLEAEIAHCVGTDDIFERLLQQWKCRFEIHTVGREDNIRVLRQVGWCWSAPVVYGCGNTAREIIEPDVLLHEFEHLILVGDVERLGDVAANSYCKTNKPTPGAQFDTGVISSKFAQKLLSRAYIVFPTRSSLCFLSMYLPSTMPAGHSCPPQPFLRSS